MTKIMGAVAAALAADDEARREYSAKQVERLSAVGLRQAEERFGARPDSVAVEANYPSFVGVAKWQDMALHFRDDDGGVRFYLPVACRRCGQEVQRTIYSLVTLGEVLQQKGKIACTDCQIAEMAEAANDWLDLAGCERAHAARLYRLLREIVQAGQEE